MKHIYLFAFLFFSVYYNSQKSDTISRTNFRGTLAFQYGQFLATNDYLKSRDSKGFMGGSAEITVQTDGSKEWHKRFGKPYYGGGILALDFLKNRDMGKPFAIYATFGGAVKETKTHSWNYETSGGFAFNWNRFDLEKGYLNPSLGSSVSIYVNLGFNYKRYLGKHWDLSLGMNFNHFSNGALRLPNKGMNMLSPKMSLTYHFDERQFHTADSLSSFDKYLTLDVNVLGGVRHSIFVGKDEGFNYEDVNLAQKYRGKYSQNWGLETVYHRQITYKSSVGVGIGILYDEDYNTRFFQDENGDIQITDRFKNDKLLLNIFPSYRLTISKFAVHIQPGFYIFKKTIDRRYNKTFFYQRVGFQYTVGKNFLIGIGLRSYHFHKADCIEWRLGYRILNKKNS